MSQSQSHAACLLREALYEAEPGSTLRNNCRNAVTHFSPRHSVTSLLKLVSQYFCRAAKENLAI